MAIRAPGVGKAKTHALFFGVAPTNELFFIDPNALKHQMYKWLPHPCHLGGPQRLAWDENHNWLPHSRRLRDPHVGKMATSTCRLQSLHVGKVATSPLPSWGSLMFRAGMRITKWLPQPCQVAGLTTLNIGTKMRNGYLTPAVSRADVQGKWLHHLCILGGPQCSTRE